MAVFDVFRPGFTRSGPPTDQEAMFLSVLTPLFLHSSKARSDTAVSLIDAIFSRATMASKVLEAGSRFDVEQSQVQRAAES